MQISKIVSYGSYVAVISAQDGERLSKNLKMFHTYYDKKESEDVSRLCEKKLLEAMIRDKWKYRTIENNPEQ